MFSTLKHWFRPYFSFALVLFGALVLSVAPLAAQYDFEWIAEGDGDWTTAANWDPDTAFPDAAELFVGLLGNLPEQGLTATITLDQEVTIGRFYARANTNQSNFIVSGTGGLVFDNGDDPSTINFQQGSTGSSHNVQVPISVVSDTLDITGRQGILSGNITAVPGNDLTINWGSGSGVTISGDNNFNNGTIVSTSSGGLRFSDSPTAAGGASTTIQLNDGDVQFENSVNHTDLNFGNPLEVSGTGTSTMHIVRLNVNNSVFTASITLGDITLGADSTLRYVRTGGGAVNNAPRVRVGSGHTLTLGDNATLFLAGTQTHIVDIMDQSLLQGTGTIRIEDDNSASRVRVLAGGTVRPGDGSATGILNVGSGATVQGRLEMQEDSIMRFRLNGTTAGSDYDQLRFGLGPSVSSLTVDPDSVLLELELNYGYNPSDVLFLIRNDQPIPLASGDFFKGLSHGDMVTFTEGLLAGSTARISYQADWDTSSPTGGLDVALYDFAVIPEPATVATILGALALGLAFWRRRRR